MRFLIKTAFLLGLLAFFLAPRSGEGESRISLLNAVAGAREALADLTGFCDRAPTACEAGGEIASFAGERVGDGLSLAYDFAQDRMGDGSETEVEVPPTVMAALPRHRAPLPPAASDRSRTADPFTTAALVPRPAAPRRAAPAIASVPAVPARSIEPQPLRMRQGGSALLPVRPLPGRDIPAVAGRPTPTPVRTSTLPLPPVKAAPLGAAGKGLRMAVAVPTPAPRT